MEWNRTETLALAVEKCAHCGGCGVQTTREGNETPCRCVLRAIFRTCFKRFAECVNKDLSASRVSLEHGATRDPGGPWGRRNEEYAADFLLTVERTLSESEYRIFRFHYLLGADWRLCSRKLKMDKGVFFHNVYRIQTKLGRVFRELQPYPLFPLREYFNTSLHSGVKARVIPFRATRPTLDVPLKRAA